MNCQITDWLPVGDSLVVIWTRNTYSYNLNPVESLVYFLIWNMHVHFR